MEFSASCIGPQTQPFHERDQGAGPLVDGFHGLPLGLRVQVRPTILQGRCQTVDHGDGRAQLMSRGGQEQLLLVLHDFLRGDVAKVHHPLVGTGDPCHEDLQPTPVLELVFDRLTVAHGQREGGMAAFHDLRRVPGQFHRGPIPLAYPAIEIQNDDAVGAGVGHCLLMDPLTVELFVGQRVADGHTSMRREQFEELDFDVADLAAAVERVQGAIGATVDVRHAQGDGVQTGQVGPDQVLQSPSVLVGQ